MCLDHYYDTGIPDIIDYRTWAQGENVSVIKLGDGITWVF